MRGNTPTGAIRAFKGVLLTVCCALVVVPFVGIVSTSLATREQIVRSGGFVIIPDEVTFSAYRALFTGGVVPRAVGVSVFITLVGTALSLASTTLLAYGLSRPATRAHRPVLMLVVGALLFTPGIIPGYLTVDLLGLIDSYWAVILPVVVSAFNVVILRAFFMEIPAELVESARIDGASDRQIFGRIVLPLSKAVLSVIGLFYAVGYWNAFFGALLYLNDSAKWPIQLVLRTYVVNQQQLGVDQVGTTELPPQEALQMAILVISIVPILLVYPFIQRHFSKGVLVGAVKG
ncbi:carbohydrate ABC transporter membrane protein 2 (CUT1 family) [Asanoa ferruginea]|uniref:Carbohydrate ABC transporter membrane protein 2 (CUT1 family) n=1 Tax=Asanoa ferruginea TaxID=53367 RepID=A0A3D9ZXU1_9ACTN|nr:carbohydrate ABC transporter permease [Asanoa ferruginea]REF98620.1 carbohydrate ABC transporter membrane protein 2 (CUT1 family) [Asanoa ferruginea]GIF50633.1 ABC transporter permease [Asanoa ferruginea]